MARVCGDRQVLLTCETRERLGCATKMCDER